MIPQGKQFNTFPNESYAGNSKLCGFPLSRKCNKDEEQPPSEPEKEEFGFGWKAVALGYGCGVIFGMVMGYVVFANGKPEWLVATFGGETKKNGEKKDEEQGQCKLHHKKLIRNLSY
ncbi:hypothetical protein L6164_029128 [Bauhinia variegata]|nr:hypothetical protein L6164_029128 [Bauhinia variegata]